MTTTVGTHLEAWNRLKLALDSLEHLIQWAAERDYYSGEHGWADALDVDECRRILGIQPEPPTTPLQWCECGHPKQSHLGGQKTQRCLWYGQGADGLPATCACTTYRPKAAA